MYELDDRTTLTNGYFPVKGFAKVRDEFFGDNSTAYLSREGLDTATMNVLRSVIPMLSDRDKKEFYRVWGEENEYCPIYDYFFYIDSRDGCEYLILALNDWHDRLTLWDFRIDCDISAYLARYGNTESRAKWAEAQARAEKEEQEREKEEDEEE